MKNICLKSCAAELIGVFILCFIGAGSIIIANLEGNPIGLLGVALAHGLALSVAVTGTMNISGGHINPAISIALMLTGRCAPLKALSYIIAQMTGAALAGFFLSLLYPTVIAEAANWGTPTLGQGTSVAKGIAIEAVATLLLSFAIYGTAVSSKTPKGIGGFGIGLTVTFLILAIGPLTGAAMNPARHFGTALMGGMTLLKDQWIYWLGPVLGATIGFLLFSRILEKKD